MEAPVEDVGGNGDDEVRSKPGAVVHRNQSTMLGVRRRIQQSADSFRLQTVSSLWRTLGLMIS